MNIKEKKLIAFDFDGTLVDSMETFADVAAVVLNEVFETSIETARRQYVETSGLPFFQQLEQIHPGDPNNESAAIMFETRKLDGYFDQRIYPDAISATKELKNRGIQTAVCSNNFQDLVDEFISNQYIELDFVLGFKSKEFCKGEGHFRYLLEKTGFSKEDFLFVGDSLKDAERAADFGVDFIGRTGLFTKNEFLDHSPNNPVIDSLDEIIELIDGEK